MIDGEGNLKLSDFGMAKLETETLDEIFQDSVDGSYKPQSFHMSNLNKKLFGEPNYVAPEILNGEEHGKSSDIWSLGCLLYEMYTGNQFGINNWFDSSQKTLYTTYCRPPSIFF
jgi:serine/threonine protein kinase